MDNSRGIIFYNLGRKCLVRLTVAAHTARKHWRGPITILHCGEDGRADAEAVAKLARVDFLPVSFRTSPGPSVALLNKTLLHEVTPYDTSLLLDADTVTTGPIEDMFTAAEQYEYAVCQFADWKTRGSHYRKRIREWRGLVSDAWIEAALDYGPAINTGVFAFRKDSKLQAELYAYAERARGLFIPDEMAVQILLPQYQSKVMPPAFNESCRYGTPFSMRVRVVHFHGNKHCRIEKVKSWPTPCETVHEDFPPWRLHNAASLWYEAFDAIRQWPVVNKNIEHDRQLRNNLAAWDTVKWEIRKRGQL